MIGLTTFLLGFIGGLIVCLRETDILKKRLRNEVKKDE